MYIKTQNNSASYRTRLTVTTSQLTTSRRVLVSQLTALFDIVAA